MSQSVWATSKASKRSRGQAQRRNPTTFTEEPKSKKTRVEDQDKSEETRRETMKKVGLQPSSGALVPWSPSSVPKLVISEFAILPTQPRPALEFYADSLYNQSLRRSSAPSCVSIEHALCKLSNDPVLNQYLSRLLPPHAKKGETVLGICSDFIRLQEGFSAIGSLAQREGKFRALIIAFGIVNLQVGDEVMRSRILRTAMSYLIAMTGQGSQQMMVGKRRRTLLMASALAFRRKGCAFPACCERLASRPLTILQQRILSPFAELVSASKGYGLPKFEQMVKAKLRMSQYHRTLSENMFWERVGSLALQMPETEDIETQVGLMCNVVVDAQILQLHNMSDAHFYLWSHDSVLRSLISLIVA